MAFGSKELRRRMLPDTKLRHFKPKDKLYKVNDRHSGKSAARPELEECRKALRAGDTLVVPRQ